MSEKKKAKTKQKPTNGKGDSPRNLSVQFKKKLRED